MINIPNFLIFLFCSILVNPLNGQPDNSRLSRKLEKAMDNSPVFQRAFTGFLLKDPETNEVIYEQLADHYFTPASNTKILSLYTALAELGDSIPALFYQRRQDSLIVWGTGNPLLLHPEFEEGNIILEWLKDQEGQLFFSDRNYQDLRYGEGWSWDDYPYGYQMEKSSLPVYGNALWLDYNRETGPQVWPRYFQDRLVFDERPGAPSFSRAEYQNIFLYGSRLFRRDSYEKSVSFLLNPKLVCELLVDTLKRSVDYSPIPLPARDDYATISIPLADTVLRQLMQDSDNFIAEQLLLMASAKRYGHLNTQQIISYMQDTLMRGLPTDIAWVDGSGLSRYNQITPRVLVNVLQRLYARVSPERLFSIFPAGGQSGTIRNWYGEGELPYVYAKTGTLRNMHCLSGYVTTVSGKTLIFSFMHNNYPGKTNDLKKEMEFILSMIKSEG